MLHSLYVARQQACIKHLYNVQCTYHHRLCYIVYMLLGNRHALNTCTMYNVYTYHHRLCYIVYMLLGNRHALNTCTMYNVHITIDYVMLSIVSLCYVVYRITMLCCLSYHHTIHMLLGNRHVLNTCTTYISP